MPSGDRSSEHRRLNKPVMEKRRRARINDSLTQLKSLVLEGMKKDPARHSKLEKADILEMAVKHLRSLNSRGSGGGGGGATTLSRFQDGYADCAREVAAYLNEREDLQLELRQRLMVHLASSYRPVGTAIAPAPAPAPAVGMLSSLQLVPTLLPSGEVGYIIQQQQQQSMVTVTAPLSVSALPPTAASVGSPSPVPSSASQPDQGGWDPAEPASPSSSCDSLGSSERDSPRPLDLVAHSRVPDDNCWRPW